MNKIVLFSIVIILQLALFFYFFLIQNTVGFPVVSLIDIDLIEMISPFSYQIFGRDGYVFLALFYPLLFLAIYAAVNHFNMVFRKSAPILFYWFFWLNVVFFIIFATLAGAYLGFVLIIIYCGLIILFQKSMGKYRKFSTNFPYIKLYVHYFILNILYVPVHLGIFALFYMGS